jgi:hypothetical protein
MVEHSKCFPLRIAVQGEEVVPVEADVDSRFLDGRDGSPDLRVVHQLELYLCTDPHRATSSTRVDR